MSVSTMVVTASYTANPFIEEIVKVLPVAALLLIPTMRRQWSLTDCVLMGAAVGSGFGLAESLFRYGAEAHRARAIDHGWVLQANIAFPVVPSVWSTINSWVPAAGAPWDQISASGRFPPSPHLVWSALGGLAVGLIMLRRGLMWRISAAVLLVYVALDHAAWNAAVRSQQFVGRAAIEQLRTQLWLAPILALALAWWLDRQRQHVAKADQVSLAAEQSMSPRLLGTLRAAVSRPPWSLPWVYRFVRLRRAYNSERTSPLSSRAPEDLSRPLVQHRDRLDRQLAQNRSAPLLPPGWSSALTAAIRGPSIIVWLLLMVPSVMWFVIGGLPQTAAVQNVMTEPVAWKAVVALSLIAQAWLAWRIVQGLRGLPRLLRLPLGDDAALFLLRAACGVGAIGLGGHAMMRALSGFSPTSGMLSFFNSSEAYASATPATTLPLASGASAVVPPRAAAGKYIGEVDDPNFASGGEGTYIGEVDDPNFLGDQAPGDGAPDMSLDKMAKWAADADVRDADARLEKAWYGTDQAEYDAARDAAAAAHANADAAAAGVEVPRPEPVSPEEAEARAADARLKHAWFGSDEAEYGAARDAAAAAHAKADAAAEAAQAHAAVADADAAVAKAGADSEAAHDAYLADMAAATAADAAAKAADPSATPHAARDVHSAAIETKAALDARIAAANAAKAVAEGVDAAKQEAWEYYKR